MLCNLLSQAGVAGHPDSFFRKPSIAWWAEHLGVTTNQNANSFSRDYLDAVLKQGRGGTRVFGCRIMQENLDEMLQRLEDVCPDAMAAPSLIATVFGPPVFIHLSRKDKLAQAISYEIAQQSGLWHKAPDGTEIERTAPPKDPAYDHDRLNHLHQQFEAYDAAWLAWFKRHRITPLSIQYEQLALDPIGTLGRVLNALGTEKPDLSRIKPGVAKLRGQINQDWHARYLATNRGADKGGLQ